MTKGRKPRKRRAAPVDRKATQRANRAETSRGLLKKRIIALESRMVVLERLVGSINTPMAQAVADDAIEYLDLNHAYGEEE